MNEPHDQTPAMPLAGLRVLDIATMTPGKYCTCILADFGADVIRVERHTATSDQIDEEDLALNRNKRSIVLNLRTDEGRRVFYDLARTADVVLESHRPGAAKRMGVDYETLAAMNPRLIYCSLSGFGQDGPYAQNAAFDMIFMAISGLLGLLPGEGRAPFVPGIYVADAGSGLLATIAILLGVVARQRTGRGQYVDLAMLDSAVSMLSLVSGGLRESGEAFQSETLGESAPAYNVYETSDGKYLALGVGRPQSWQALCRLLGREDLVEHRWATGPKQAEVYAGLKGAFRTRTRDEWCDELRALDVEVGEVNDLAEVYADPQLLHRGMIETVQHPAAGNSRQLGIPIKLSQTPGKIRSAAPCIGQDTEAILEELGYDAAQIEQLKEAQAI